MKQWWQRFLQAQRLSRWPVYDPGELEKKEQKKKIDKLYGK